METDRLVRLRQTRIAVRQLDVTTSALTALHNERHAAVVMQAQYPGLWNTVASDNQAIQFRAVDAASAVSLLAQVYSDGNAAFQLAQAQLLSLDTTGWKDNATKTQAANAAAQAVVQSMIANPQAYGNLLAESSNGATGGVNAEALASAFSTWLEDEKLERFWAPLRQDAVSAIAALDQRLAEINRRRGFDITGSVAIEQETALEAQFDAQLKQLSMSGQQGMDDSQKALLASYQTAFQGAVAAVQSDPTASQFVTVRWPS
jgi:hypothetical protein